LAPHSLGVSSPPDIIVEAIRNYGHIDIYRDETNVPRELPLVIEYQGSNVGALSLEMLRCYQDVARADVVLGREAIRVGTTMIPVDSYGGFAIRHFDNVSGLPRYSMIDVLAALEEDPTSLSGLRDKIVILGINSKTYYPKEISYTPAGVERPNVYLHADVISNMLSGFFFSTVSFGGVLFVLIAVAVIFGIIRVLRYRSVRLLISLGLVFGILCADFFLFHSGIKFPAVTILTLGFPLTIYTYFGSFHEQAQIIRTQEREKLELRKKEASLEEIQREIRVARAIQEHLLPKEMPDIPEFDVFGLNVAAKGVSGDFFDFVRLSDGRWGIVVADVSGKGISAAILLAAAQSVLRTECLRADAEELKSAQIISECNRLLFAITDPARFVTMFYGILDSRTGHLSYVNAGHNSPVLLRHDGKVELLEYGDIILAVMPDYAYTARTIDLSTLRKIVIYSDGVVEASNGDDEMYGEDRLLQYVSANGTVSSRDLAQGLVSDVSAFSSGVGQSDDITVVVLGCGAKCV
jgi:serine phosphatase RsbU (regulator of sigma subunit)